jgi:hypothetical protein
VPHQRWQDSVLALSKAFALAGRSDDVKTREEFRFFRATRAALVKSASSSGIGQKDRELAAQKILGRGRRLDGGRRYPEATTDPKWAIGSFRDQCHR